MDADVIIIGSGAGGGTDLYFFRPMGDPPALAGLTQ